MKSISRHKITILSALSLVLTVAATSGVAGGIKSKEGDFSRGAQAWVDNCSRCHNPRDPKEFRDDLWRPIVYHMRVRGGLTGQQTRDILKFLQGSN